MDSKPGIGTAWLRQRFSLVLCVFLGCLTGAVEIVEGPWASVGERQAEVRWRTDVPAGGRVDLGTNPGRLDRREKGPTGTNHVVRIDGLRSGTRYFYSVGTARHVLATNSFATSGGPSGGGTTASAGGQPGTGVSDGAGGTTGSPAGLPQAPPASVTWGAMRTLQDHFDRHGRDFAAKNPEDYARQAWQFLQRGKAQGLPAKLDSEGTLRVYEPGTRAFGAYNRDGTTRTFFKPRRPDYFKDQPGRRVNLREWR